MKARAHFRTEEDDDRAIWEMVAGSASSFDPRDLGGAVTAWLRVQNSTVTGSGISSLPDLLNTNPAAQGTDALRPALGTSANGFSLITGASGKVLTWPLAASNNGTSQWGIAVHVNTALSAAARCIFGVRGANGANFNRVNVRVEADESVRAQLYIDDANSRSGFTAASVIGDSTIQFVTVEFDGTQGTEAGKVTITVDGVVKVLSFANDSGAGAVPATLVAATGSALIGAFNTAGGSSPFTGFLGPNIYILGAKMSGATEGLLTAAARTALGNLERPT